MKTQKILIFLFLIFCFAFSASNAQNLTNTPNIKKFAMKKVWEVGGSIGFIATTPVANGSSGDMTWNISFSPFGGFFVAKGLELGVMPSVSYTKHKNFFDFVDYTLYFAPAVNFLTKSKVFPYIMGLIGYCAQNGGGFTASGLAWGGEGGIKINAYGNSLLKLGLQYEQKTLNPQNNTGGRNGQNNIKFEAGYNVFF